ncbi:MAG: hypothetical protein E7018_01150 [Alphaproteobacteria bacterium]|nr:hypothetical protein [Alphaproteobacteria bacterium]
MMNRKFAALALVSALVLNSAIAKAEGKDGVAAVVNGQNLTVVEIRDMYETMPGVKDKVSFEEFYEKTLNDFIGNELVFQAATADKVTESDEYKKQLKAAQKDIAGKIYLKNKVESMIGEEQVKKVYDDYKKNFKSEKEVKAKHILVDTEAKAKEVISKLDNKGDFDALAKEYSREPADLGYFTKDMMVPEFGEAAFALGKGVYTKMPVKTQFGYHVILVEDIRDGKPMEYEKIKPQLKALLAKGALGKLLEGISSQAKVTMYDLKGNEIKQEAPVAPKK